MPSAILMAAMAAGALASAIPARMTGSTFSVEQVRNEKFVKNGPLALAKAYHKFGAPIPDDLKAAVARIKAEMGVSKRTTGSVAANPEQYDSEYLCPVSIGTPAQLLNLDFDTGSSDLWVFSSETSKSEVDGQALYNPSKSSTAQKISGATWSISYGDGSSSSGDVYDDVVTVGGLTVTSQAVESAKQVSDEFSEDSDNDGLLGLGFSSINQVEPTKQKTFFDNAKASLDSPVFTADLKAGEPGKYSFGYIDSSAYTGTIAYTSVDSSEGYWGFTSPAYAIGSAAKKTTSVNGIADTGTTLLLLPTSVVQAYYKQVSGSKYDNSQGGYTFPCSATLPSFSYYIGSTPITIPGSYINYAPVSSSTCFGGIQEDTDIGFAIYGDVALKAAFVVFSGASTPQLGFATKSL